MDLRNSKVKIFLAAYINEKEQRLCDMKLFQLLNIMVFALYKSLKLILFLLGKMSSQF